jgi:hypothetical protein
VTREATYTQFFVAVTPGTETGLYDFRKPSVQVRSEHGNLTVQVRSEHGNLTGFNPENLVAILWT